MTTRRVQGFGAQESRLYVRDVGQVINIESVDLAVNASAVVPAPIFGLLMSASIITTVGTRLAIHWSGNPFHNGPSAVGANGVMAFRFRLDGSLLTPGAGTSENAPKLQIESVSYDKRVPITPGPHTVDVEWSLFGAAVAANTMFLLPVGGLADFVHANLTLQEQA